MQRSATAMAFLSISGAVSALSCGGSSASATCGPNGAGYDPAIDPASFSATIDNKYLSFTPGTVARYTNSDGQIVEQDVTSDVKVLMGVPCMVVHDFTKTAAGDWVEDTYDYFAQDQGGNVWYFGEDTKAYVGKDTSSVGSWQAGVRCAKPGIVMKAQPQIGDKYRQEYLEGEAEDEAEVVTLNARVTVPYGTFTGCLETKESSRLAPGDLENKFYCPGIFGPVSSVDIGTVDAGKKEELVSLDGKTSP